MKQIQIFTLPIISLHVILLLLLVLVVPTATAAENPGVPSMPLILKGNATLNGVPADVGMEVTVKINDKVVGTTEISTAGIYGDLPTNRLLVTSEPEDYDQIKFYINGVESEIAGNDLKNARPGDTINLEISANNDQQIMNNTYVLILLGGILIIGIIAAIRYKLK